jgi:hypothetical protein
MGAQCFMHSVGMPPFSALLWSPTQNSPNLVPGFLNRISSYRYYGMNICVHLCVDTLISNVMVCRQGAFGRWLRLDSIMRMGPS